MTFDSFYVKAKDSKPSKKAKTSKKKSDEDDEEVTGVKIEMNQHVALTFSLKYLVNFSKSATLSKNVELMMSNDIPLLVSPPITFNASWNLTLVQGCVQLQPRPHPLLPCTQDW